jgi:RNA recognition motif-containing protein
MNIHAANLSRETTETDLKGAFAVFGRVEAANIIRDKFSGESHGFGFVDMPDKAEAEAAIAGLNGKELKGSKITVSEVRTRNEDGSGEGGRKGYRGSHPGGGGFKGGSHPVGERGGFRGPSGGGHKDGAGGGGSRSR